MTTVDTLLEKSITENFDKFAFFGGQPGTTLCPVTTIELQTKKVNPSITELFENSPALRFMEQQGWVIMPGGRQAILTEEGAAELTRRQTP